MRGQLPLPEMRLTSPPPRAELLQGLALRLGDAAPGWRPLAENILGAGSRIDFVGLAPGGRLTAVLVGNAHEDLELVARGVAQRDWLSARIPDWLQLSTDLAIRPDLDVQAVLLCPAFRPEAIAAARALGDGLRLATYRWVQSSGRAEPLIEILMAPDNDDSSDAWDPVFEPVAVPTPRRARAAAPTTPAQSPSQPGPKQRDAQPESFRTGLSDEDLGLTAEELAELE